MGFGFGIVAAGVAAGCYWGYRRLLKIEEDIRAELEEKGLAARDIPPAAKVRDAEGAPPVAAPVTSGLTSFEERVLAKVRANPGLLQTELYQIFPDGERKALQAVLLKMDRAGVLRRSKEKGTYRLEVP